jgi:hypothetical protein
MGSGRAQWWEVARRCGGVAGRHRSCGQPTGRAIGATEEVEEGKVKAGDMRLKESARCTVRDGSRANSTLKISIIMSRGRHVTRGRAAMATMAWN